MTYKNNSMRYEKKYIIRQNELYRITHLIKNNDLFFKPIFYPRFINSIYFDNENLELYKQNINGLRNRKKFRIRWYSDNEYSNFEVKIKNGFLGTKEIFPFGPILKKNKEISFQKIDKRISKLKKDIDSNFNKILSFLKPTLFVSYKRSYFLSKIIDCRLTLDEEINYYKIENKHININPRKTLNSIVELKYPFGLDSFELSRFSKFPFRYSKYSKYVRGMQCFL